MSNRKEKRPTYLLLIVIIALLCGYLNYYHVSTMFENDRHFSHLSNLEREMTFRTEMGLYYSYYKRIVEAPSFLEGLDHIMNDNLTEYPHVINTLQRFNLYPEVVLGAAFRGFVNLAQYFDLETKECWQVDRGDDLQPVWSCEGLGDPSYFYLTGVWICAGSTVSLIFLYGFLLSESILGGLLSVICFFFNHGECTRVQWTPPLRESFGYPILLGQMLTVTWCLRRSLPHWKHLIIIALTTSLALVTWQFSQFVLLTQTAAIIMLWLQNQAPKPTIIVIFLGQLVGLQNAVLLLFANEMLLTSLYACALMAALTVMLFLEPPFATKLERILKRFIFLGSSTALATLGIRLLLSYIIDSKDDAHIWNLLQAKMTSYRDFHTLLYICAAEFDFLPTSSIFQLTKTLLLPSVYASMSFVAFYGMGYFHSIASINDSGQSNKLRRQKIDAAVLYNILQLVAFVVMAALIMRLKLFMSPHLCLAAGLLASRKYMSFIRSEWIHWAALVALVSAMSVTGMQNLRQQREIIGEYSNPAMEELIHWIQTETPSEAAFAGPMPITATILLTTKRPIVNHPHYEDEGIRERTKKVYKAFGRGTVTEFYRTLVDMKISYLVLQEMWCFGQPRAGCSMLDIWDVEEPHRKAYDPLCPVLFHGNASPLQRVFSNQVYVVLRVPSRYVEVTLPRQYRQ